MKTMSSRCGSIGARPGPELHRRAAALGPPVRRLDAVREEHDAEAQRRPARGRLRRRAAGARLPAPAAASTRATAAPARRRRRGGSDGGSCRARTAAMAHGLFSAPEDVGDSGPCDGTSAGGTSAPRARLRNWRLVDDAGREVGERRVAAGLAPSRRSAADPTPAGCARARSRSSCATASSSPCCPASAGSRAGRRRRRWSSCRGTRR